MSDQLEEMALFPLNVVLFPHSQIRLHVFEDRYREMVRRCVESDLPIGIVLIREGEEVGGNAEPYLVGTAARIDGIHTYEDGRMDISLRGERRFRIRRLVEQEVFPKGWVEPIVEEEWPDTPRTDALVFRAQESFSSLIAQRFGKTDLNVRIQFPNDPGVLSFAIASCLPLENLQKQQFLEMTDSLERLAGLIPIIDTHVAESTGPTHYRLTPSDLEEWITPN